MFAVALCGCAPDAGKNDLGRRERSSAVVPASMPQATAPTSMNNIGVAADTRPVVVCFGDSITAGYGVEPDLNYPVDLQHILDAQGYRYRVLSMGVSGETTKDGLLRVSSVLARRPEVVIVEFGGNDGLRGLPIADTQRNLTAIVTELRHGGAKVLVAAISLPTQYGPDYIGRFNAVFPAVTRQTNVSLLTFAAFTKGVYGVDGNIQDDGIHPTATGDRILANNVGAALVPMLHR